MYWEQTAAMWVDVEIKWFTKIKYGADKGVCSLFLSLSRNNYVKPGGIPNNYSRRTQYKQLELCEHNVLIAENIEDIQQLLDIVQEESSKERVGTEQQRDRSNICQKKQWVSTDQYLYEQKEMRLMKM